MFELIRSNKKKSIILFFGMGLCLIILGYLIGSVYFPYGGDIIGIVLALLVWFVMSCVSYFGGSSIILSMSNAHEVSKDVLPKLHNIVEEMQIAANLPVKPKIYLVDEEMPNAFATGRDPQKSSIAVTAGLLTTLNRDELQGVIAHEMSHILNRDILFMTFAGTMLGSIVLISEVFLKGLRFTSGGSLRYRSRSSRAGGSFSILIIILSIVFAILGPILARLLYFAISRKREYLADATAVRLTRYPEGLASALEKISQSTADLPSANKVTAAFYIVNPLKKSGLKAYNLTSTHPPIYERVKILRAMMYGANYTSYQEAYSSIKGKVSSLIPAALLSESKAIPLRKASLIDEAAKPGEEKRAIGDLIMSTYNYQFITCDCGMKLKLPSGFGTVKPEIKCPKCGHVNEVNQFQNNLASVQ